VTSAGSLREAGRARWTLARGRLAWPLRRAGAVVCGARRDARISFEALQTAFSRFPENELRNCIDDDLFSLGGREAP
jgi:hypothetical protein